MILCGDCLEVMRTMEDNSIDAIVTDPPYGLKFMNKEWDRGIPGSAYWEEALRVSKPGTHMLVFGGTRTYHRLTCAIEDAGWEIRDCLMWLYGSGFPKSHNLKGKHAGKGTALKPAWEPVILARKPIEGTVANNVLTYGTGGLNIDECRISLNGEKPYNYPNGPGGSDQNHMLRGLDKGNAKIPQQGNGEGRFPANIILSHSPDCVKIGERKIKSHGSVSGNEPSDPIANTDGEYDRKPFTAHGNGDGTETVEGWVCADGCPIKLMGEQSGTSASKKGKPRGTHKKSMFSNSEFNKVGAEYDDSGTAARYFKNLEYDPFIYCAKASPKERGEGNTHPTVKPLSLMKYLIKLITPPGGIVLDPFAGSGSTLIAAKDCGFDAIGIEINPDYVNIAASRIGVFA